MAAGSSFGTIFQITTWGESHGKAIGVVVDGCPAGLALCEEDIQKLLDRRKPGQSKFATKRSEGDMVEILSGTFEGKTTGTPISLLVRNTDQRSRDYSQIASCYRPGHADYTFDRKFGFRDYRGGGRSSARETIGRVAAGAIAEKFLAEFGIAAHAYVTAIGPVQVDPARFDLAEAEKNKLCMPDAEAALAAGKYLEERMAECDSVGGIVECVISGLPAGLGEPVFDKLDANLAKAILSIGAVKGFEIGAGFEAARLTGSENNDAFRAAEPGEAGADGAGAAVAGKAAEKKTAASGAAEDGEALSGGQARTKRIYKVTNHSGGVLGGISDGSDIVFRAAFKATPSIAKVQQTVNQDGENIELSIHGRHDPVVVPRAAVVVEAMGAITVMDLLLLSVTSRMDTIRRALREK